MCLPSPSSTADDASGSTSISSLAIESGRGTVWCREKYTGCKCHPFLFGQSLTGRTDGSKWIFVLFSAWVWWMGASSNGEYRWIRRKVHNEDKIVDDRPIVVYFWARWPLKANKYFYTCLSHSRRWTYSGQCRRTRKVYLLSWGRTGEN